MEDGRKHNQSDDEKKKKEEGVKNIFALVVRSFVRMFYIFPFFFDL